MVRYLLIQRNIYFLSHVSLYIEKGFFKFKYICKFSLIWPYWESWEFKNYDTRVSSYLFQPCKCLGKIKTGQNRLQLQSLENNIEQNNQYTQWQNISSLIKQFLHCLYAHEKKIENTSVEHWNRFKVLIIPGCQVAITSLPSKFHLNNGGTAGGLVPGLTPTETAAIPLCTRLGMTAWVRPVLN